MKRTALEKWICKTEALPKLTRESLEALQLKRLNELLERERLRKGFYRNLPTKLEALEELKTLPLTCARDLSESCASLLLVSQGKVERIISGATSGTTGPEKRIFYTEGDLENTVGFFAAGISEMTTEGDSVMIAMPFSGADGLGELISRAVESLNARAVKAQYGMSCGELASLIEREKPAAFIGMPVPLLSLIRYCGGALSLKRALISADVCPAGVASLLERELGNPLFPHYGSRETALGGTVTCEAHEGMHLRENHIIAEIVDENGKALPPGERGELVLTTIGMQAMPLLRYRTGDIARLIPEDCACGGVTRRLEVFGRCGEGKLNAAALDSELFKNPALVDCRYHLEGKRLKAEALLKNMEGEAELRNTLKALCPEYEVELSARLCTKNSRPLYMGKRYIL